MGKAAAHPAVTLISLTDVKKSIEGRLCEGEMPAVVIGPYSEGFQPRGKRKALSSARSEAMPPPTKVLEDSPTPKAMRKRSKATNPLSKETSLRLEMPLEGETSPKGRSSAQGEITHGITGLESMLHSPIPSTIASPMESASESVSVSLGPVPIDKEAKEEGVVLAMKQKPKKQKF